MLVVSRELLEAIATPVQSKQEPAHANGASQGSRTRRAVPFSLKEYLQKHQLEVIGSGPYTIGNKTGTRYQLKRCTWDSSHTDHAACVYQFEDGTLGASCSHNSCRDKGWKEFRAVFEPVPSNGHRPRKCGTWKPFDEARDDPPVDMEAAWEFLKEQEWGDAKLFVHLFRGYVVYDHSDKSWYYYREHYWEKDKKKHAPHLVAEDVAGYYLLAASDILEQAGYADEETQEKLQEQAAFFTERAKRIRHHNRISNILTNATSIPGLSLAGTEWDSNPLVVGCPNGVIDLPTGQLRPGAPGDHIRTITRAEYHGLDTPCPRFDQFLHEIFQDIKEEEKRLELIHYLQKIIGYGISGYSNQAILPTLWGPAGRNGKGTLQRAISYALGDICDTLHKDALIASRGRPAGSAQPYLADLHGKRLLWASETDEGERFNVAQVKMLTGNDDIKARNVYERAKTFQPTHTLILMTNHKPHADSTENPFWHRMKLIPLNISFVEKPTKEHERPIDENLEKALKSEASGILAWCVRGFLMYQREGLNTPKYIEDATSEYRKEEDVLEDFVQARCEEKPDYEVKTSHLYESYKQWFSAQSAVRPMSDKAFHKRAKIRWGQPRHDRQLGDLYRGVRLVAPRPTDPQDEKPQDKGRDSWDTCDTNSEDFLQDKEAPEETPEKDITSHKPNSSDVISPESGTPDDESERQDVLEKDITPITAITLDDAAIQNENRILELLSDWGAYRTVPRDYCRRCGCRLVARPYGIEWQWNKDISAYAWQHPGRPYCIRCQFPSMPIDAKIKAHVATGQFHYVMREELQAALDEARQLVNSLPRKMQEVPLW